MMILSSDLHIPNPLARNSPQNCIEDCRHASVNVRQSDRICAWKSCLVDHVPADHCRFHPAFGSFVTISIRRLGPSSSGPSLGGDCFSNTCSSCSTFRGSLCMHRSRRPKIFVLIREQHFLHGHKLSLPGEIARTR